MEIPKYMQEAIDEAEAALADGTAIYHLSKITAKLQSANRRAVQEFCAQGEKPNDVAKFLGITKQRVEQIMHPERDAARKAVAKAIAAKKLTRQSCRVCGDHKTEGHHEDYSKPLEVVWLCRVHHLAADAERRARVSPRSEER